MLRQAQYMFLKSPNRSNIGCVALEVGALTAIVEVPIPGGADIALTRTPIVGDGKTPNGCSIQIEFIKLILTGQIPITITV